jgi:hypothetical protein
MVKKRGIAYGQQESDFVLCVVPYYSKKWIANGQRYNAMPYDI